MVSSIKDNFHFSETIDTVKSADLYPEFKIGSDENVGYFNPFMVGELENITKIGKEASVLTMLPFYKRVITKIIPLTKDNFQACYGINYEDFKYLVDAGKILPLLPWYLHHSYYTTEGENISYLQDLFQQGWPSDDRHWLVSRHICLFKKNSEKTIEKVVEPFTKIAIEGGKKIFENVSYLPYFIKLCNRLIYRGEPFLIINYLEIANTYKIQFQQFGIKEWEYLTIALIDIFDNFFQSHFISPEASPIYSKVGFDWLCNHLNEEKKNMKLYSGYLKKYKLNFSTLSDTYESSQTIPIEHLTLLRKTYLHDPIEAVGDIKKMVHWLDHSINVEENQKILNAFSKHLKNKKYKVAMYEDINSLDKVMSELNKEMKLISFDMKASKVILQIGCAVGSALAAAGIGHALSAGNLDALFAMCGALAASVFANTISENIINAASKVAYRNNFPFMVLKKRALKKS